MMYIPERKNISKSAFFYTIIVFFLTQSFSIVLIMLVEKFKPDKPYYDIHELYFSYEANTLDYDEFDIEDFDE